MSVYLYSVFVLFCIGSGLVTGWSPVQGVLSAGYKIKKLQAVYKIKKLQSGQGPTKDCRAIDR
jgi:hypothetical protein